MERALRTSTTRGYRTRIWSKQASASSARPAPSNDRPRLNTTSGGSIITARSSMGGRLVLKSDHEVLRAKCGSGPWRQLDIRSPRDGELGVAQSILAPVIGWHLPLGLDQ